MIRCRLRGHDFVEDKRFGILNDQRTMVRRCERCGWVEHRLFTGVWRRAQHVERPPAPSEMPEPRPDESIDEYRGRLREAVGNYTAELERWLALSAREFVADAEDKA
jgi:hypothetical protein